ncbi:pleiotropic regulatory protein RsmS [Vibrio hippocampi]|uniref:Primosomal protein n=1 Tax=Vibrio hippocampi TaxID=654686 RepID=A0ABN8DK27_9VIBR|nr:pleiotropic regulatory protein RsmS [Vibrio hippocampi]CAH0526427.1 hypothetical protein VHP8226_01800 [Vibrio hippocampi]
MDNKNTSKDAHSAGLDNAPEEIKLAVDLIYLLETNEIEPSIALKALAIVRQDLEKKLNP